MQVLQSAADEHEYVQVLRQLRWPNGPLCPHCLSPEVIRSGTHLGPYQRYRCKECMRIFNDKTRTIFEDSRLPLQVWFYAASMLRSGVTIMELSRRLGMNYDTTHRMVKKLRRGEYWLRMNEVLDEYVATTYGSRATLAAMPPPARRVRP